MGIADLFRPKYRHSDVKKRTAAVKALTHDDAAILVEVARTDRDIGVRRLAIGKIEEAKVLADIAAAETERSLRDYAGERAALLWSSTACSDDEHEASEALAGIMKLGDQHALVEVAVHASLPAIRKRAFGELRDPRALAELAKGDAPQDIRLAAVARIDDGDVLRAVAIDTTIKEVGLAAVDKLDDKDRLEHVAQKAKNKAVRQRARKIVQEIDEAERSKKPGVPDDVKRRRAEKAQLIREVEAVADTFDFAKVAPSVEAAQAAWQKLAGDDGDERFTKAVERFWKRKEIHDQQARSSDELRAVEREVQREKEARKEEDIEARIPDDIDTKPEPALEERRLQREAEAKARREERERRKAEDDAKQAERDAKRKEDAERGEAIATSLEAMCADMEQLAESSKDGRAIDRLLQQAAKAFEQVGKVPGDRRDALSDRYTAARGKLVVRASELREAQDWQRFANVPKAEALIQTAKEMLEATPTPDLGNRLRQLQALWKEVGPMPQRRSKELWQQFKATCDQIYDKVKQFRAGESERFAEVAKVKEALIAEAETLAESTDWNTTAQALKALQARWKESGHLPRKQGDEMWKRFRAACDRFFERRKPQLDAQRAQEAENLAAKQALIARAHEIANAAPGEGGWGKAIAEIKELQRKWKDIGFVPRRDADAVYKAFRAACDALFAKRAEARDGEANAHREEIDAVKAEIAAVMAADGEDAVARAQAVRARARELDSRELTPALEEMVRHVIATYPDAVKGSELDPHALRAKREKLIGRLEELLPKQAPTLQADAAPADIAAQLKQAMRSNAFGDLRFSGRDPVEVLDDLRTQWLEAGPILDDEDRAQQARYDELVKRVVEAVGAAAKDDREHEERGEPRGERGERNERRRRRRDKRAEQAPRASDAPRQSMGASSGSRAPAPRAPMPAAVLAAPVAAEPSPAPTAAGSASMPAIPAMPAVPSPPAPEELRARPSSTSLPSPPAPEELRARPSSTSLPPMDEVDEGWDLGDDDPTATSDEAQAAAQADDAMERPEPNPPSASEMAGDSATGGDGIDEPGWD